MARLEAAPFQNGVFTVVSDRETCDKKEWTRNLLPLRVILPLIRQPVIRDSVIREALIRHTLGEINSLRRIVPQRRDRDEPWFGCLRSR